MNHAIAATAVSTSAKTRQPYIALQMLCILGVLLLPLLTKTAAAQTTPRPFSTHLRLQRPKEAEVGSEIAFRVLLINVKTKEGMSNKLVRVHFNGKEVDRGTTNGNGEAVFNYTIPTDTVPESGPGQRPIKRSIRVQAFYDGSPESKKCKLTGTMRIASRTVPPEPGLGGRTGSSGVGVITPRAVLQVFNSVFEDAGTVVKYHGSVFLKARLTLEGKGVEGQTVTFTIPNAQGREYEISAVTDREGYAAKTLNNVTWLLVPNGPWTITARSNGQVSSATLTLQRQ